MPTQNDETLTEKFEGHTPEPWEAFNYGPDGVKVVACGGLVVARLDGHPRGDDEAARAMTADGLLAAAAPTLLRERDEALRRAEEAEARARVDANALRLQKERRAEAEAALEEARREREALALAARDALEALTGEEDSEECSAVNGPDGTYHILRGGRTVRPAACPACALRAALAKAGRGAP